MVREAGIAAGACALVVGAGIAVGSIAGLVHDRDHWKAEALAPHPSASSPAGSPSTPPAEASSSPPSPSTVPPGFRAQAAARSAAPTVPAVTPRPVTPRPSSTPRPTPTPSPTASSSSCTPALVTVTLPLGVSCNTLVLASVARVGGTK